MHQGPILYRFRPGVLDHVMRSRNLTTDRQLAVFIGVRESDIPRLRAGALVTPSVALKVSDLQGDIDFIDGYFERVTDQIPARI